MLHTLKAQANAALADDARVKREVENARRVLTHTAEVAADALDRLAHAEEQLEMKWAQLASLLSEVKSLEMERHEAMVLAQQLAELASEGRVSSASLDDEEDGQEMDPAESAVLMALEPRQTSVADLRAALKQVVQSIPSSRLTR
ncbi:MAG: hypothetical protein ACT4TC_26625 [Myxococcaceae bacterium]